MVTQRLRRKTVTMEDVAKHAGVSITTVSHVLNHTASISPETTRRIECAIEELNYIAKNKKQKNDNAIRTIGVLTPDISNEFYAKCVQAMCEEARLVGYTVLVCGMRHDKRVELNYIKTLIDNNVGGLIYFGGFLSEKHIVDAAKKVPLVLGDRYLLNYPISSVITDNREVMRQMVAKLKKAGYSKLGFLSEDLEMSNVYDRYNGFKIGVEENSLELRSEFVHNMVALRLDKTINAYSFMKERLQAGMELPEVYLCSSDLIAIGVLSALREFNIRVPRDIGIVGFDNISIAAHTQPPLTTIAQNMQLLGKSCVTSLLQRIENRNADMLNMVVKAKIVVRNSVKL